VAAVTEEDRALIERAAEGITVPVVPDGADHVPNLRAIEGGHALAQPDAPLAVLLANFAYAPNVDAATYLCGEILPRIRARVPDVRLWLVGNAPPAEVRALQSEEVEVTGQVPDVLPYLDAADVVLCPLRIGGGIKVKTIEALRRGKAIVCSSVAAQGLPDPARRAMAISDHPAAFASGAATLLADPAERAELERRAGRAAMRLATWDDAAQALCAIYDELIAQAPRLEREVTARLAEGAAG
jgi:hypothetical protein